MTTRTNRRLSKRYTAQIHTYQKSEQGISSGCITNLSRDGAFLKTDAVLPPDTTLELWIKHVNESIPIQGRVAWSQKVPRSRKGMGIQFIDTSARAKAMRDDILLTLMYKEYNPIAS